MLKLETLNELTLKVTCDGQGRLYTKKGAWIGGEYYGNQAPFRFEKALLGPGNNAVQAIGNTPINVKHIANSKIPIMILGLIPVF